MLAIAAPVAGFLAGRHLGALLPIRRFVVEGASMEPAYHSGGRLLVNCLAYRGGRAPAIGDVVVLRDPEQHGRHLVKRVATSPDAASAGRALVYVVGDNAAESRDSRAFGAVPASSIVGRAWLRY